MSRQEIDHVWLRGHGYPSYLHVPFGTQSDFWQYFDKTSIRLDAYYRASSYASLRKKGKAR